MPLLAARQEETAGRAVVRPVGQELQGEKRMGRAALAQIPLTGVRRPAASRIPFHHEVNREPTEGAFPGKPLTDSHGRRADQSRVGGVGGEDAAEVALSAGTPEKLIMS